MSLDFVDRIIKTSLLLAVILFPFLALYLRVAFGVAFVLGCAWGCLNLFALRILVIQIITPKDKNILLIMALIFLKFPLIYFLGYLLVVWAYPPIFGLVWGFSSILMVTLLKVLSRHIMQLNAKPRVKIL